MKLIYETKYHLRTLDFDCQDVLTPTSILNSFQDVAGVHAELLGVGFDKMVEQGYYWVVLREKITFLRNAGLSSEITVRTWPLEKGRVDFRREYEMLDDSGNLIAYGSSVWVVINKDTRRLARATEINYTGELEVKKNYESIDKLPNFIDLKETYIHKVRYTDIDHNGHMNNAKYADIILDILNMKHQMIKELQIDFVSEARLGQDLVWKYKKEGSKYFFEASILDKTAIRALVEVEEYE